MLILLSGCHKRRRKSQLLSQLHRNKICERCFLCRSLELCKSCHKCPNCCHRSTCRGKATPVLGKMGNPRGESKGSNSTQRGLHPPIPVQTQPNQITNCHKQLCQPSQKSQSFGGPVSAAEQKCSRTGRKSVILQPVIFGTQTQQLVETDLGPEHLEHLPKHRVVQNGDTETIRTSLQVGEILRTHTSTYQFSVSPGSTCVFTSRVTPTNSKHYPLVCPQHPQWWKEVKLMALQKGIRIHQYLDDWLVRATSHQTCLLHTQTLVALCQELGWTILSGPVCPVQQPRKSKST